MLESDEKHLGLTPKYNVQRISDATGKHADCRYFVLDPKHDPFAFEALMEYATCAREAGYQALYDDLIDWLARCPTPPSVPDQGAELDRVRAEIERLQGEARDG